MTGKKKLPVKRLNNLYESVGLYDALYNRHLGYKMGEAGAFAKILQAEEKRPKTILELFASTQSRHKDFFKLQYHYWGEVLAYKCLDGFASPQDDVIVADAGHGKYGEKFDAIFAYYYAVSSAVDPDSERGHITWEYTQAIFSNVLKHLNPGGIFVVDSAIDGYRVALSSVCDDDENTPVVEVDIPLGHSLRAEIEAEGIKLNDKDDVMLKNTYSPVYDRMSANCEDWFKHLKVYVNGKARLIYKVKQPFCQRYFSEPETVQMLKAAGFESVDFWSCDYEGGSSEKQEPVLRVEDGEEDEEESLMPNIFVGRAPK